MLVTNPKNSHELMIGVFERAPGELLLFLNMAYPSFTDLNTVFHCVNPERALVIASLLFESPVRPEWTESELAAISMRIHQTIESIYSGYLQPPVRQQRKALEDILILVDHCLAELKEKRLKAEIDSLKMDDLLNTIRTGDFQQPDERERANQLAMNYYLPYSSAYLASLAEIEPSQEVRQIIAEALEAKLDSCSSDFLEAMLSNPIFKEMNNAILRALGKIGYSTAAFLELRKRFPWLNQTIINTIQTRPDLPFEVVVEIFDQAPYAESVEATFSAVLPQLSADQVGALKPYYSAWHQTYTFYNLVAGFATKLVAIEICLATRNLPKNLAFRSDCFYEELIRIYQNFDPDDDKGSFARHLVERFSSQQAA